MAMRVILGVDGSDGSCAAAQFVGRLLSASKDEVLLYYSPPSVELRSAEPVVPELGERVQQLLARAVFDDVRNRLPAAISERAREIVGTQKPSHGILVAADEYRADLVVVGARGSGLLREPTVGSVARAIAHHATVPSLIVRQPVFDSARPLRVLLASDGSPASRHAAEVVGKFSWPADTVGRVLTVVEPPLTGQIARWLEDWLYLQEVESLQLGHFEPTAEEQAQTREHLVRWCGELPALFQKQPPLAIVGHARQEILKAIDAEQANLVVVGARGLGTTGRLLLGSTSEHLLMHAPSSIMIVRQHEKP
jgi:nucleotide-binding universal stress UspA family protein